MQKSAALEFDFENIFYELSSDAIYGTLVESARNQSQVKILCIIEKVKEVKWQSFQKLDA